jgi:hypothetical protein
MSATAYQGWAMLELMGHRQRVGQVSEVEMYGGKMLRIDILVAVDGKPDEFITEFYGCSSVYALTPISEQVARDHAKRRGDIRPVQPVSYRIEDHSHDGDDHHED